MHLCPPVRVWRLQNHGTYILQLLWLTSVTRNCQRVPVVFKCDNSSGHFVCPWRVPVVQTFYVCWFFSSAWGFRRFSQPSHSNVLKLAMTYYSGKLLRSSSAVMLFSLLAKWKLQLVSDRWSSTICLNYLSFLNTIAELRKATCQLRHCMSVWPNAWNNSISSSRIFTKFDIPAFFRKSVEKIQVSLKAGKNNGYFTWRRFHVYDIALNDS
jgi:hypothetical protein